MHLESISFSAKIDMWRLNFHRTVRDKMFRTRSAIIQQCCSRITARMTYCVNAVPDYRPIPKVRLLRYSEYPLFGLVLGLGLGVMVRIAYVRHSGPSEQQTEIVNATIDLGDATGESHSLRLVNLWAVYIRCTRQRVRKVRYLWQDCV